MESKHLFKLKDGFTATFATVDVAESDKRAPRQYWIKQGEDHICILPQYIFEKLFTIDKKKEENMNILNTGVAKYVGKNNVVPEDKVVFIQQSYPYDTLDVCDLDGNVQFSLSEFDQSDWEILG